MLSKETGPLRITGSFAFRFPQTFPRLRTGPSKGGLPYNLLPIFEPHIDPRFHFVVVFPGVGDVVDRRKGPDQDLIVVSFVQTSPVVIICEQVACGIEEFKSEIPMPDFAEDGTGDFPSPETEDLIGGFLLKK